MCGLAGIVSADLGDARASVVAGMRNAIRFRGRDDEGVWTDGRNVVLLQSRLSIIDPAGGHQPMRDSSDRYVVTFTGEIYNYVELRRSYEEQGARFRTDSDTEVLLEGFRLHGDRLWPTLNGMFAVAIWDTVESRLVVARDHLGKKPLFWTRLGATFYFSSNLDAFAVIPGWTGELDEGAIAMNAILGGFPEDVTIYRGARRVPYASWASVDPRHLEPRPVRYWRIPFGPVPRSRSTIGGALEEYETVLTDAVRVRLRSDVPVALTFSGGVDSGTIAAIASRKLHTDLQCFTIDHDAPAEPSVEARIASDVAARLELPYTFIEFDYRDRLLTEMSSVLEYYDEPCRDPALVYSYELYRALRPAATVVLSGNGADELFFGYDGNQSKRREVLALGAMRLPAVGAAARTALSAAAAVTGRSSLRRYANSPYLRLPLHVAWRESVVAGAARWTTTTAARDELEAMARTISEEMRLSGVRTAADLAMFLALTLVTMDSNYRIPDISGLAAQVEVRSPFLDHRMVEFAAALPLEHKVGSPWSSRLNKNLPKRYYQRYVPDEIAYASKKGMAYNLRWDLAIAHDPDWQAYFDASTSALAAHGIDPAPFRDARAEYARTTRSGTPALAAGTLMTNGLMLGAWLDRRRAPALAAS